MGTIAIDIPKEQLRDFCRRWKVTEFALFGSAAHGDFKDDSDVDVLVSFAADATWSLFDFVQMKNELEAIFGREVDLVDRAGMKWMRNYLRREAILNSAVSIDLA